MAILVKVPAPRDLFKRQPDTDPMSPSSTSSIRHAEAPDCGVHEWDGPDIKNPNRVEAPDAGEARSEHFSGWHDDHGN